LCHLLASAVTSIERDEARLPHSFLRSVQFDRTKLNQYGAKPLLLSIQSTF
jgi:hypothetical protein